MTPLPLSIVVERPDERGWRPSMEDCVFHFLLPGEGWACAAGDAEIKRLLPDEAKALRSFAGAWRKKLTASQVKRLLALSQRAEEADNVPASVETFNVDEEALHAAQLRERALLYVGASRARDRLAVSWNREPSTMLAPALATLEDEALEGEALEGQER